MKQVYNLIFLLVIVLGISQNSAISQTTSFVSPNYEITFPNTWELDTSNARGTEFFIYTKSEIKREQKSQIISLIVQNLASQNIDIVKYKQITERQMAGLGSSSKIFKSEIIQSTKGRYFQMLYSITQDNRKLKGTQICFIKNEKAYLITFTSDFNKFEQYRKVGEIILNSFSVYK